MNYIVNGDFADAKLEPWEPKGGSILVKPDADGNYAFFEGAGRITQHWLMPRKPKKVVFGLEILVEGGSNLPLGQVQLVLLLHAGTHAISETRNIPEISLWYPLRVQISLVDIDAVTLSLLVQEELAGKVSMKNISFTDDPGETKHKTDIGYFELVQKD